MAADDATKTLGGPPRPAAPVLARGATVGRYLIVEKLAEGGMGAVYVAYDPELDRRVALKLLKDAVPGPAGEAQRQRLLHEAQAMAKLAHPNVVPVFDAGALGDTVFLTMELVTGATLREWRSQARRTWRDVVERFIEAAQGLAAAHDAGLVHRDFKPTNVLVGVDGRARVTDFGVARSSSAPAEAPVPVLPAPSSGTPSRPLTPDGLVLGTVQYMAPEQLEHGRSDAASDQYAFCVSLFEVLRGHRPGEGLRPGVDPIEAPAAVQRVIDRGLEPSPTARFVSMRALSAELERVLRREEHHPARWGALSLMVVSAGVFGWWQLGAAQRRCGALVDEGSSVWGATRREALDRQLSASNRTFAAASFRELDASLRRYLAAWRAERLEVCLLPATEGQQGRAACLDDRLVEADATLRELESLVPKEAAERAVSLVHALTPLSTCARARSRDATAPGVLGPLSRRLAEVKARYDSGGYGPAVTLAQALVQDAEAAQATSLAVEARLHLGRALERTGRLTDAERTLTDAAIDASSLGRDDVTARASSALAQLVGGQLQRRGEGLVWTRQAAAAITRLGGSLDLSAEQANAVGAVHRYLAEYEAALPHFEKALALTIEAVGEEHTRVAAVHNNLGSTFASLGRLDRAMVHLEKALALRRALLGDEHPAVALVLHNLAEALSRAGRLDEALSSYRQARASYESAQTGHPLLPNVMNGEGEVLAAKGDWRASLEVHRAALALREKALGPAHPYVAYDLTGCARALVALGAFTEAEPLIARALTLRAGGNVDAKESGETSFVHAQVRAGVGDTPGARASLLAAQERFRAGGGRKVLPMAEVDALAERLSR
jgi:tetratricopeptide (TPR) repeat protein/predicted Ser/Thr protein kinase